MNPKHAIPFLALALSAAVTVASAQAADDPVNAEAVDALKRMGAFLQTLERFEATSERTTEAVLADGQKLQTTSTAELQVRRPDRLRLSSERRGRQRELVYDGKTVTIYTPALKYYASAPTAATIGAMVEQVGEKFGIEFPMVDLFRWGSATPPAGKFESAMNAGQELIGEHVCNHYAYREAQIDWQLWIRDGEQPLPCKVVITSRTDEARPQSSSVMSWNLKPEFEDTVFTFTPPEGAMRIGIRPVDATGGATP